MFAGLGAGQVVVAVVVLGYGIGVPAVIIWLLVDIRRRLDRPPSGRPPSGFDDAR